MRFPKTFHLTIGFMVVATCLGVNSFAQTPPPAATPTAKPKSTATAPKAAKPAASPFDRALLKPALLKDTAPDTYQVKFETTRGDFTVSVTRAWAPLGADRFYNLVKHHFYDGARIYRVAPNFVAQFGISAYPPVSAAWSKATINDDPVTQKNKRGTITFAKTSLPNSRATDIFINLKDNTFLDSQGFAPFGVVDGKGINIVEMFYDQYGDAAGVNDQENMKKGGEEYIATRWPKLDTFKSVSIVGDTSATPPATTPAKPTATPKP
ncbi:MAG: peptidylprolyl isomerase [Candidatus Acidiferrum sp.]